MITTLNETGDNTKVLFFSFQSFLLPFFFSFFLLGGGGGYGGVEGGDGRRVMFGYIA